MKWKKEGQVLVVLDEAKRTVFFALDDCFGVERIETWAIQNKIDPTTIERLR